MSRQASQSAFAAINVSLGAPLMNGLGMAIVEDPVGCQMLYTASSRNLHMLIHSIEMLARLFLVGRHAAVWGLLVWIQKVCTDIGTPPVPPHRPHRVWSGRAEVLSTPRVGSKACI